MRISLIWAMSDDRVIGIGNRLPWRLPADMRWFRRHTLGKPVIMGRKTYASFGETPLPGRKNIVVTHDHGYQSQGAEVVFSIDEALAVAEPAEEAMIIGGALLYQQLLPHADRLYMTKVHGKFRGDTWFPAFDPDEWQETESHAFGADDKNRWPYSFYILDRKSSMAKPPVIPASE